MGSPADEPSRPAASRSRNLIRLFAVVVGVAFVVNGVWGLLQGDDGVPELAVGDCFDADVVRRDAAGQQAELAGVTVVDCAEEHDNEVFHVFVPERSGARADVVRARALEECEDALAGYVEGPDLPALTVEALVRPDDGSVVCYVHAASLEPTTGSLEGSEP